MKASFVEAFSFCRSVRTISHRRTLKFASIVIFRASLFIVEADAEQRNGSPQRCGRQRNRILVTSVVLFSLLTLSVLRFPPPFPPKQHIVCSQDLPLAQRIIEKTTFYLVVIEVSQRLVPTPRPIYHIDVCDHSISSLFLPEAGRSRAPPLV
jgi:hypothetical protein